MDDETTPDPDERGLEVEKWILRFMVTTMLAIGFWAVAASVDDIKRYLKMKQM